MKCLNMNEADLKSAKSLSNQVVLIDWILNAMSGEIGGILLLYLDASTRRVNHVDVS